MHQVQRSRRLPSWILGVLLVRGGRKGEKVQKGKEEGGIKRGENEKERQGGGRETSPLIHISGYATAARWS